MKFSCEKHLLQDAISVTARSAASKSPNPTLVGILFEATRSVKITGYDLTRGVYTSIPADISQPGSIVLDARLIDNIISSLPDDIVNISVDNNNMTRIVCGDSDFSILGMDAENYPQIPAVDKQKSIKIPQKIMKDMINQTIFAVSDSEARPLYTGALFKIEGGKLTLVSVDGYRLAMRKESIEALGEQSFEFIAPGTALQEVEKICCDSEEQVSIDLGAKNISFTVGERVLITRRLEGDFMDYKKTVPTDFLHQIKVKKRDLLSVVERVSLIIDDRIKNPLRCIFGDGKIIVHCMTALGKGEDICKCQGDGGEVEIGFNNRYVLDAIKAAPVEEIAVGLSTGSSPCLMVPSDGSDKFMYMILPVRLRSTVGG